MFKKTKTNVVHETPEDLKEVLICNPNLLAKWNNLTPLARNEWICWIESVKKPETRKLHIERTSSELIEGMRRPCCWIGCVHRADKSISHSVRGIIDRRSKKNVKI